MSSSPHHHEARLMMNTMKFGRKHYIYAQSLCIRYFLLGMDVVKVILRLKDSVCVSFLSVETTEDRNENTK